MKEHSESAEADILKGRLRIPTLEEQEVLSWGGPGLIREADGSPKVLWHGGLVFSEFDTSPRTLEVRQHYGKTTWGLREKLADDCWTWTGLPCDTRAEAEAALAKAVVVRPGCLTDDLHTAYTYAGQYKESEAEIKSLYLRMQRPLDLRDPETFQNWAGKLDLAGERDPRRAMAHANFQVRSGGIVLQRAHDAGFDGIIYWDTDALNKGLATTYAFFRADQVREAPNPEGYDEYYGYRFRRPGRRGPDPDIDP